ncbi:MAG: hypothetical protein AAF634_10510, partial [Bacteroidota bacterium]
STSNGTSSGTIYHAINIASGPATVIFRVGGTVIYSGSTEQLDTNRSNVYLAGQTAPGGGFGIRNAEIRIDQDDWIIRHLHHYGTQDDNEDGIRIQTGGSGDSPTLNDIYIANNTLAFHGDENLSIARGDRITVVNNVFGDGQPYAVLLEEINRNITFYQNLFVWNEQRNIRASTSDNRYEFLNNKIYGYTPGTEGLHTSYESWQDIIGNDWENSTQNSPIRLSEGNTSGSPDISQTVIYHSDNIYNGVAAVVGSNFSSGTVATSRQISSDIIPYSSSLTQANTLANAGAGNGLPSGVDSYTQKLFDDVSNNVSNDYTNSNFPHPTLASGTPYADFDEDGLSDDYERSNGGDITSTNWSDQPTTAIINDGRTLDFSGVSSGLRPNHGFIFIADMANDWSNF